MRLICPINLVLALLMIGRYGSLHVHPTHLDAPSCVPFRPILVSLHQSRYPIACKETCMPRISSKLCAVKGVLLDGGNHSYSANNLSLEAKVLHWARRRFHRAT